MNDKIFDATVFQITSLVRAYADAWHWKLTSKTAADASSCQAKCNEYMHEIEGRLRELLDVAQCA